MKVPEAGYGVVPLEQVRTLDGMTLFTEMVAGRLPAPPICETLGIRLTEVEKGRVVFA